MKKLSLIALIVFVFTSLNAFAALTLVKESVQSAGSETKNLYSITFDAAYPTGGEALSASSLSLSEVRRLKASSVGGYVFEYDYTNSKIKAFDGALTEVSNGTDLSTLTIKAEAYGR